MKLRLWALEPRLSIELYRPTQRPGKVAPLDACVRACTLWEVPGRYRLFVKGWPNSHVHPSSRDFELVGPSAVTVQPPNGIARGAGLAMGITGSILFSIGLVFTVVQTSVGGSEAFIKTSDKIAAAALLGGGATLGVSGWILFGSNLKPSLRITPLER